jgi:hypothetical protein
MQTLECAPTVAHAEELTTTGKTEYEVLRNKRVAELRVAFQPVHSAFLEL